MKIRYSLLPTLMVSLFSYPVYSATTVTTYQGLLDELASSTTADVVLDMNGGGIDLDGADGVTISQNQSVLFKNIGTEGSSSWTDTRYNIKNSGTVSINNVILSQNNAQIGSGVSNGGAIIQNRGKITEITDSIFNNNNPTTQTDGWGGIINNYKAEIGTIKNVVFSNNSFYSQNHAPHGGVIGNSGENNAFGIIKLIDNVTFENNVMTSAPNQVGGAHGVGIDNNGDGIIEKITNSKFINNLTYRTGEAELSGNYHASGGAMDNYGYIGEISNTLFKGNSATTESVSASTTGGAIMNVYVGINYEPSGKIDKIVNVQFIENYVYAKKAIATGGAIDNGNASDDGGTSYIGEIFADFIGNYAKSDEG